MFKPAKLVLAVALSLVLGIGTLGQAQVQDQKEKSDKTKSKVAIVLGGKRLGIVAGFVTKEHAENLKLGERRGVLVRDVIKDSSADRAGLKSGDVIIEVDGQNIESHGDLRKKLQSLDFDRAYSLKIVRDGNAQQVNFTLDKSTSDNFYAYSYGANSEEVRKALEKTKETLEKSKEARKKAFQESRAAKEKYRAEIEKARAEGRTKGHLEFRDFFSRPRLGVETQRLNDQLAKYFGVEKGVLISHVSEDSVASKAGLLAGDVITEINGVKIDDSNDLRREINKIESGEVRLTVFRNRQRLDLRANLEPKAKVGENFDFFPDVPLVIMPPIEGNLVIPELKIFRELKDLPNLENLPNLHFNFDTDVLMDLDIYL
ncbi:MAG: PDZ domain-containing protein [Acidobacteria bacterium]|nr:PDZ domain-containing protein [Acidobacteriota bacterium]